MGSFWTVSTTIEDIVDLVEHGQRVDPVAASKPLRAPRCQAWILFIVKTLIRPSSKTTSNGLVLDIFWYCYNYPWRRIWEVEPLAHSDLTQAKPQLCTVRTQPSTQPCTAMPLSVHSLIEVYLSARSLAQPYLCQRVVLLSHNPVSAQPY